MWVLGCELRSFAKASSDLNHWGISPAPVFFFFHPKTRGKAREMQVGHKRRVRESLRSSLLEPSQGNPVNGYSANGYEKLKNRKGSINLNTNLLSF